MAKRTNNGARTSAVNNVEITGGGRTSGSRNMCLISGRIPLTGAIDAGAAEVDPGPPMRRFVSAIVQRNGLLIIASPMINSTLYLPDLMPNSVALLPISFRQNIISNVDFVSNKKKIPYRIYKQHCC